MQLIANSNEADAPVRQAAAVHFKNIVKKGWDTSNDDTGGIVISEGDRQTIKTHLVELMCTVPPKIQAQCSESIALIAKTDYPKKWTNLLPELVSKFNSPSLDVVNGVLQTADSLFKSFRYVERSDELYAVIIYSLKEIQAPLLTLFKTTSAATFTDAVGQDVNQLVPRLTALRYMCRIFFSLNYQDLPEYFEDHISEWMEEFSKFLQYSNSLLVDADEEDESSPIDKLQTAIIANLNLYADKDEEPFIPFLPTFTKLVWNLLISLTTFPKHDSLATAAIRFLALLVSRLMHKDLFNDEQTLRQIISNIVIPNLKVRDSDEEKFEDDPADFILTDIEGSDSESRRKCSQDLLRSMCRVFESETTNLCSEHINSLLTEYTSNPGACWKSKDIAIHLMFGISIKAESTTHGVSQVNENVNVMDFFTKYIYTELQDTTSSSVSNAMLKSTAIKFVSTFRNQFTKEQLVSLMPLLIGHLSSTFVVVHTYAAYDIEKILTTKIEEKTATGTTTKSPKFTSTDLQPFLETLFTALFNIVDNSELNENEYVMKCVMRALVVADQDVIPVTQVVLEKITAALGRVAKNPRNPQFNHYMFESIAVLVKSACSTDPNLTSSFEGLLFPPFQTVLQLDVSEFTPYVFQILAQLLEYRPPNTGLGDAYEQLLPPCLSPVMWERKGNIPALTRLLAAYLSKASVEIVNRQQLLPMLGVFQKLLSSKANQSSAFQLMSAILQYVPSQSLQPYMTNVFQLLLTSLQSRKSQPRFVQLISNFFALYVGKFGSQGFMDQSNSIQDGLAFMLIVEVWLPKIQKDLPTKLDAKIQIIGLTKILCETGPALLAHPNGQQIFSQTLITIMAIITSPTTIDSAAAFVEQDEIEISYDTTYSSLRYAMKAQVDPFSDITDPSLTFIQSLNELCQSQPGQFQPIIQEGLASSGDPKLTLTLANMFQKAGLQL